MSNLDSLGAGSVLFSRTQSTPAPLHLQHDVISKVGGGSSFLGAGSTFLGRTRSTSSSYDSFSEDGTAAQAPADIKSLLYHKAGSDPSARSMVHFQHLNRLNSSSTSSSVLPNINVATEIALGHIAASPSISGTRQRFASNRASRNKVKATAGVMRLVAREGGGDGAAAIGGVRFSMLDHQSAFGKKSKKKKQGDLSLLMPMQGAAVAERLSRVKRGTTKFDITSKRNFTKEEMDTYWKQQLGQDITETSEAIEVASAVPPPERSTAQLEALVGYLVKLGAFEEAPPLDLFLAVRSLRKLVVEPGEEVWDDDVRDSRVLILLEGEVAVVVNSEKVGVVKAGDFVGDFACDSSSLWGGFRCRHASKKIAAPMDERLFVTDSAKACTFLSLDAEDLRTNREAYEAVVAEGSSNRHFIATLLASLDLFRAWGWLDLVLMASADVQGVQVDAGLELFRQGETVEGVYVLQYGECQMERAVTSKGAEPEGAARSSGSSYGVSVKMSTGENGELAHGIERCGSSEKGKDAGVAKVKEVLRLGQCAVFGEEMVRGNTKGLDGKWSARPTHDYAVRALSSASFLYMPKSVVMASKGGDAGSASTYEKAVLDELKVLLANRARASWTARVPNASLTRNLALLSGVRHLRPPSLE